jgi:anthranilate/para-aminobenzoate synthase component II
VAERDSLPDELEVSATDESETTIMAVRHKSMPLEGLQFHPESILTDEGKKILKNFLTIYG